ncbi:MAG: hypothetical protein NTX65_15005 [Ignavibacteriales bacterium]|nr:hypothetical protein [Ignavibacteriales bacterium]
MERAKWNGTITERRSLSFAEYFAGNRKIEILGKIKENITHLALASEEGVVNGTIARKRGTSFDLEFRLKYTIKRLGIFNYNFNNKEVQHILDANYN